MNNTSFSCYVMGKESLLIQCTEILLERGHDVRGVISNAPAITQWASDKGLPILAPGKTLAANLAEQPPFDYFLSITNLAIIPDAVLALPKRGAINFHDGPLPKFAGLYATSWALMHEEASHGVTWHEMKSGIDKGDILAQHLFEMAPGETAFTLNVKAYEAGIESFIELVAAIENNSLQPRPQNLAEQTYFGKYDRPPATAMLDWSQSASTLVAMVNALQFGGYANPLALPKLLTNGRLSIVSQAKVGEAATAAPGTILAIAADSLTVATAKDEIILSGLQTLAGTAVSPTNLTLQTGDLLPSLDADAFAALTTFNDTIVRQEGYWLRRLTQLNSVELPYAERSSTAVGRQYETATSPLPTAVSNDDTFLTAAFAAYLARLSGTDSFDIGLKPEWLADEVGDFAPYFATQIPFRVKTDSTATVTDALARLQTDLQTLQQKRKTFNRDLFLRHPELEPLRSKLDQALLPVLLQSAASAADFTPLAGSELTMLLTPDKTSVTWVYDTAVYPSEIIAAMQTQFATFLNSIVQDGSRSLAETAILSQAELEQMLVDWNATEMAYDTAVCIHQLIEAQAEERPHDIAVVYEDQQISYRQLNSRANQMARHLRHLGVGPDKIVGVFMERSIDMMVGLIGIHKAGGAYLPLDPNYPQERIAYMVEDAETAVILTQERLAAKMPPHQAKVVKVDADWDIISEQNRENVVSEVQSNNLSYVIYTSGSTGKPKGVMIEHRNVINFFAGMDERVGDGVIAQDSPGTWLAVTSLSFDISALELFWTLTRGFKLVIFDDKTREQEAIALPVSPHANKEIGFSLFYFSSDESEQGVENKYDLLMKGVQFGDRHGFEAVWTPERHFHAFGGLYPNPSVVSAAIAVTTENIRIRTGSYVLPLHNPVRAAEEWALVDNLSNGRVGLGIAAGWQPNDFVLYPGNYANRKEIMFRDIETVRKLWRGESVMMEDDLGKEVAVQTLPHPIQKELPIWITAASNPETFKMAGERGFNVLTHLLGQSVEETAEKIAIYRKAWHENGHEGEGHITLMLHTFIGDDDDEVREIARKPMSNYLASAVSLVRKAAWHFPTFKEKAKATGKSPFEIFDSDELTQEDVDAVLNFAFERYFETSGLFGTPATALKMVNQLKGIGVDEIGCLIDFGIPSALVLQHLHHLNVLKEMATPKPESQDFSIAAQINRHSVTHFQCTPSMANMLLVDENNKAALSKLKTMLVGGEAFSANLAAQLKSLVQGDVINMYGPTETTIWSSTYEVTGKETAVPIGKPIANTQMYILDKAMQPVPVGVSGDLYIAGDGVVRGYLNRPELTAERFVQLSVIGHPLSVNGSPNTVYRTGDLARYRPDGSIDFLGRADFQVKMRGYRIEMGEIEALLNEQPAVREAVVVAREDVPGDMRLVAYLIPHSGQQLSSRELRDALKAHLPEFMVPAHFVTMDAFPLTPNKKTDRKALPAPDQVQAQAEVAYVPPSNELGESIAEIWRGLLNVQKIGINDNFFDIGGHSLFAVQAHRQIQKITDKKLSITDIFRFPTIRTLVDHLSQGDNGDGNGSQAAVKQSADRAASRREKMAQRRNRRQRTR